MRFLLAITYLTLLTLLVLIGPTMANAQQTTAKSLFTNEKALSDLSDQLSRKSDSAELHGNTTAQNMYTVQHNMVVCIINTLMNNDTMFAGLNKANAQMCDDTIAGNIANHDLGNNQTILALSYQYLAARGIK